MRKLVIHYSLAMMLAALAMGTLTFASHSGLGTASPSVASGSNKTREVQQFRIERTEEGHRILTKLPEGAAEVRGMQALIERGAGEAVFQARFNCVLSHWCGNCARPIAEFEVLTIVSGSLDAKRVRVLTNVKGCPNYLGKLIPGRVYQMRLIPSDETRKDLKAAEGNGQTTVFVDLAELRPEPIRKAE